ncbi:16S rRNA (cytidine(1402)-2'-O)-methyltransferase [Oceanithermus sp.]
MKGRLVLVPTPIGNLGDITLRALEVLRQAEVIACEDTRRTAKLLRHYGIHTPLVRLDQHTMNRAGKLFEEHRYIAYASDAGTPGISDPGAELVGLARERGFEVEVLPGPTALVPALVVSGFPSVRFVFEGFLPVGGRNRRRRLEALERESRTVVLYESPHHLRKTLTDLTAVYGPEHPLALVRELSKKHEEVWRGTLAAALAEFTEPRGEFVIVLGPRPAQSENGPDAARLYEELRAQGLSGRKLAEELERAGLSRNQAREWAYRKEEG